MRRKTHTRGRVLLLSLALSALGLLTGSVDACKTPTQMTVVISTLGVSCHELRRITISVAERAEEAESKIASEFVTSEVTSSSCESATRVGTLVLTPASSASGAIVVTASYTDARCKPPYADCIVARRRFSFVDHTALTLPITLSADCRGIACDVLSSCRAKQCVDSQADCSSDGSCAANAEPVVGPDGKPLPPEAGIVEGGVGDDAGEGGDGDAVDDAAADAPVDADGGPVVVDGGGNSCPPRTYTNSVGPECVAPNNCCFAGSGYGCSADCQFYATFPCTGTRYCQPGQYCCALTSSPVSGINSACTPTCGTNRFLCTFDTDCPPSKPSCTATFYEGGAPTAGRLVECQ